MYLEEKTLSAKYVFNGKVIDVRSDEVEIANGHKSLREVVEHSGGVVIVAINKNKLVMVKQFRYPIREVSVELPAGKLEKGENPDFASKRELKEETGYVAKSWKSLGYIYTTPGFCNEKLYLYLAKNLEFDKKCPDEDEIIESEEYDFDTVYKMIDSGVINDSKTICAIMRAREYMK